MTSANEISFIEKRKVLQQKLQEQRQQLSRQWALSSRKERDYPRSMTIRFFNSRPDLMVFIKGLVLLLVGVRLYQSVRIILMLARLVQLASLARQSYLTKF